MEEAQLGSATLEATLKRLQSGSGLTKSRKQLMFTYKLVSSRNFFGTDAQSP